MYQVKSEYNGQNVIVALSDETLALKGLSNRINLDLASQKELQILHEMGHPFVEKLNTKSKGVE